AVFQVAQIPKQSFFVKGAGSEMASHQSSCGRRISFQTGVRIQLGKKLLNSQFANGKHKRLVTVITGPKVSFAEYFCHRDLSKFFSVTKDAKLSLAHENFPASDKARLPAFDSKSVIGQDLSHLGLRIFCFDFL